MNDETREAMYYASKTNRLTRDKEVTKVIQEPLTDEEIKRLLLEKSPVYIFCTEYSSTKPCWYITKQIMPSDEGVWMYADNWADKTPQLKTWEQFIYSLKLAALETIRF